MAAGDSAGLTEEKLAARKGPPAHAARARRGVGSGGKEHRPTDASDRTALPRGRRGARDWPRARAGLPPLLVPVSTRRPEPLHYIGVSYGITAELFRFWKRAGFLATYVRQVASDITGEHTCICLKPLEAVAGTSTEWLPKLNDDFRKRFTSRPAPHLCRTHEAKPEAAPPSPPRARPRAPAAPARISPCRLRSDVFESETQCLI